MSNLVVLVEVVILSCIVYTIIGDAFLAVIDTQAGKDLCN